MFKLTCLKCGKEIIIKKDKNRGHFMEDGVTIFQTINDELEFECNCGNKVIL